MTVHLDTSALIDALTGSRRSLDTLIRLTDQGHRVALSALVLYEWRRGPRTRADLSAQEAILPSDRAVPFGPPEAALAARLYQQVPHPRGREVDLAIAACAMAAGATLWTLNQTDFQDIPGLKLGV